MPWIRTFAAAGVLAAVLAATGGAGDDQKKETAPPPKPADDRAAEVERQLELLTRAVLDVRNAGRFVLAVSAAKDAPFTLTEWADGSPFAVTAFRPIPGPGVAFPDQEYANALEKYLTRALVAPGAPKAALVVTMAANASYQRLQLVLAACERANVKQIVFTGYVFGGGFMTDTAAYPADHAGKIPGYTRHENRKVDVKDLQREVAAGLSKL